MDYLIKQIIILHNLKHQQKPDNDYVEKKFHELKNLSPEEQQHKLNKLYKFDNFEYSEDETIDFLTIVKNGEFYYKKIFPNIYKNLSSNLKNIRFFIYENNSNDGTKDLLSELSKKYDNIIVKSEDLEKISGDRIENIKIARNNLREFYIDYYFENPINNKFVIIHH